METVYLLIAGGLGALAKDLVSDNKIVIPKLCDGVFDLGFLGGMFVGAFVGYAVDHNPLTALLSGYVGISILDNILPKSFNS
jgi:UDP-3-O-acyl-N-acetylglucosamine deacetylase